MFRKYLYIKNKNREIIIVNPKIGLIRIIGLKNIYLYNNIGEKDRNLKTKNLKIEKKSRINLKLTLFKYYTQYQGG